MLLRRVQLALHDVELAIDFGQAAGGLDQDHSVHAVGDVLGDHRGRAVVDEQPKIAKLLKLNTNEHTCGPSPRVLEAIQGSVTKRLKLYTDNACQNGRAHR